MAKKYPGLYLYYDWIDALSGIPAGKAMAIIQNLRNYAQYGTEPPPLTGTAGSLQGIFIAQITRAKINAENGKKGGAPTHKTPCAKSVSPIESHIDQPAAEESLRAEDFDNFYDYLEYLRNRVQQIRENSSSASGS